MSATHRMVNGKEVPLSPEEAAVIEAEWAANAAAKAARPVVPRRDLFAEIDALKVRLEAMEARDAVR